MIDWHQGGWTGSLKKWVRNEIRQQCRDNLAVRRRRYSWSLRVLRCALAQRSFGRFLAIYATLTFAMLLLELVVPRYWPEVIPAWTRSGPPGTDIKALLNTLAGYLITAQVGVLGVIAIAIGLVTLIVQTEDSSTDVQVYYHESLAVEVVASNLALLTVLVAQIVWPLQFLLHRLGEGTDLQLFKLVLATAHVTWLLVNLTGLAHFVVTTFRFVQKGHRELLRERYTANILHPEETARRVTSWVYANAGASLIEANRLLDPDTTITFGFDWGQPERVELERDFDPPMVVHDVRFRWIRWAVRRWSARCHREARNGQARRIAGLAHAEPKLVFTPQLDVPLRGRVVWCWTMGAVPLTSLERFVIERSFRFRRVPHEA